MNDDKKPSAPTVPLKHTRHMKMALAGLNEGLKNIMRLREEAGLAAEEYAERIDTMLSSLRDDLARFMTLLRAADDHRFDTLTAELQKTVNKFFGVTIQ